MYRVTKGFALLLACGLPSTLEMSVAGPIRAEQKIPEEIHSLCLESKDYAGCVTAQTKGLPEDDGKRRWQRDNGDQVVFDPKSVKYKELGGKKGRYIQYSYTISGMRTGRPGFSSPGIKMPSTTYHNLNAYSSYGGTQVYGTSTTYGGNTVGAINIPGRPGGYSSRKWTVQADCKDYTANWDGDKEGWRKVRKDSEDSSIEAKKVLDEFCPKIEELMEAKQF